MIWSTSWASPAREHNAALLEKQLHQYPYQDVLERERRGKRGERGGRRRRGGREGGEKRKEGREERRGGEER